MQPTLHLPSCLFAMPDLAPPAPYAAKFIRPYDTKERKETMVVPWEEDRMSLLLFLRRRLGFAGWLSLLLMLLNALFLLLVLGDLDSWWSLAGFRSVGLFLRLGITALGVRMGRGNAIFLSIAM